MINFIKKSLGSVVFFSDSSASTALISSALAALGLIACSNGDFMGNNTAPAASNTNQVNEEASLSPDDPKDAQAIEPQMVAGAFLTCAYLDTQEQVTTEIKKGNDSRVSIGCGLYRQESGKWQKVQDPHSKWTWSLLVKLNELVQLPVELQDKNNDFNAVFTVPTRLLATTIQVEVDDGKNKLIRRRSIPTVGIFGAKSGFKIEADLGILAIKIDATSDSASGNNKEDPNILTNTVVPILKSVFGEEAVKPVSSDNGTAKKTSSTQ